MAGSRDRELQCLAYVSYHQETGEHMPAEIRAYARPRQLYRYRALTGDTPDKFRKELDAIVKGHV